MPSVLAQGNESSFPTPLLVVLGVLLFGRYLYLRSQRSPGLITAPRVSPPLPTPGPSGGSWLWLNRKDRLDRDTELVIAHTDLLLAKIKQIEATGSLLLALRQLGAILEELKAPVPALDDEGRRSRSARALTINEIDEMVAALPDISPQLRAALMNLLRGRLAEKVGQ